MADIAPDLDTLCFPPFKILLSRPIGRDKCEIKNHDTPEDGKANAEPFLNRLAKERLPYAADHPQDLTCL